MARKKTGGKYKLTLSIDEEFARRFGAYCQFIGEDMSEVFARAAKREMKGFSISRRVGDDELADAPPAPTVRISRQTEAG